MTTSYLQRIRDAHVYDVAIETPLERAPRLSARLSSNILLKREDLQPIFSFKLRGAYNKLASLTADERDRGVICSSAGNHGQGVALAARKLGTSAVITMPETTPRIKTEAVRAIGGEVVLHGATYDDAYERALKIAAERRLTFIHPFDDPDIIAGQGTIAVEILRQHPEAIDAIFVPVGGGGLIAGIAAWVRNERPAVRVIGVEPDDSAGMSAALSAGRPVRLDHVGIFADGVAVRRVGDETFRLCRELVDSIVLVNTDEICAAIQDIFEDTRAIVEPAGALAVAGLKKYLHDRPGEGGTHIAINSGANMNFDRLRHVTERAALGEHREALIGVEIPERRGSFLEFCEAIGRCNITEFNYRYGDTSSAHIFVGVELESGAMDTITRLTRRGYRVLDMSDNEMAKIHVRHMVGGLAAGLADERIFRFEFPERRGALLDFLRAVGINWNISLFHYRNHGSDYGRVLAGIQVPAADDADFRAHLDALGYPYREETSNAVYRMFLSAGA